MLLPLYHHIPSISPKPLTDHIFPPFPNPKTLAFQHPKLRQSRIRCFASNTKTLPKSAIKRIADKLRSLGFTEQNTNQARKTNPNHEPGHNSAGEIFVPLPDQLPKYRVGYTIDSSWSTPENPLPKPGSGAVFSRHQSLRREVKKERQLQKENKEERTVPTLAELSLPPEELRRLRTLGIALEKKLKVGKAGITEGIVNGIHERWRRIEVVKIFCEDICKMNMKRTHDVLEAKTGGLVVWRSGSKIVLYRGVNYKYPYFISDTSSTKDISLDAIRDPPVDDGEVPQLESASPGVDGVKPKTPQPNLIHGVGSPHKQRLQLPGEAQQAKEADCLLEGLGPRFTDWWGYDPLPIDADLLPAIVPGYRRPFRLLPFGLNPKLTNDEMTTLRRLGRPLHCHFALGRNRKHEGLAVAIIKLWEKCEIAKIAVKRGVQNTNSELMAEELKWLTGGQLLSRDKDFIVLYRGKDFLPSAVSSAIEKRRKHVMETVEQTRKHITRKNEQQLKLGIISNSSEGESGETKNPGNLIPSELNQARPVETKIERTALKLSIALEKKKKTEKLLEELANSELPKEAEVDREGITEEERFMLRKVGLRMDAFLLLGRRGVFDGTVENMHLHWKHRELVKIISYEKTLDDVHQVARVLEAESGGILVAVERVRKGYAIIVYRGKNYQRPSQLRPQTLLSKRQAMKRSLEAQRRESLKLHVLKLTGKIDDLKTQLTKDEENSTPAFEESRLPSAEKEMESIPLSEPVELDAETDSGHTSQPMFPSSDEDTEEASNKEHRDSTYMNICDNGVQASEKAKPFDFSLKYDLIEKSIEVQSSVKSIPNKTHEKLLTSSDGEIGTLESTSSHDKSKMERATKDANNSQRFLSRNGLMDSSAEQTKQKSQVSRSTEDKKNSLTSKDILLSNKERLLLRKQALKMKKRPTFAVGKSNVVSGVAKAIKTHFVKNPLAIVNIKGRAKGTSAQEVIFKLKAATRSVLVSQEPSKVILYRGYGAETAPHHGRKNSKWLPDKVQAPVSRELIEAIKFECGLVNHSEENTTQQPKT